MEKKPRTILIIGGSVSSYNSHIINKLTKKLRITRQNLLYVGFIPNEDLYYYYHDSLVTLYTVKDEAFGLTPIESMACGTPVIAFKGSPSETIINGKTGYVIKSDNTNLIASKILEIINNSIKNDIILGNF